MKLSNYLTAIACIFFTSCMHAQNEIEKEILPVMEPKVGMGIGRLQISLNQNIYIYAHKNSTVPFDTIRFTVDKDGEDKGKFRMKMTHSLKPMDFYEGDSEQEALYHLSGGMEYFSPVLAFKVIKETKKSFQVVINEETMETGFIRKDEIRKLYLEGGAYWGTKHNSGVNDQLWMLFETWEIYMKRMMHVNIDDEQRIYDKPDGNIIEDNGRHYGPVTAVDGEWACMDGKYWFRWTDGKKILIEMIEEYYY